MKIKNIIVVGLFLLVHNAFALLPAENKFITSKDILIFPNKSIRVRYFQLSTRMRNKIKLSLNAIKEADISNVIPFSQSAGAIDLGMNNVPVLDQGSESTCVTFASTAALDALLNKGDYVDQECSLQLDLLLGRNYWDGAWDATEIINPLLTSGFIPKNACFGAQYPDRKAIINLDDYIKNSIQFSKRVNDSYTSYFSMSAQEKIAWMKKNLRDGHRVVISTYYLADENDAISRRGFDVVVAGKKYAGGLWACKQHNSRNYCDISYDTAASHELVLIGYDDKQQLFKVRNSWSNQAGENGDYYMTYAFVAAMVWDGTEVYYRDEWPYEG